jgi:hypothetical protein
MADQSTSITSPVEIKTDSEASVALDLARIIATGENHSRDKESEREYWLTLYYQYRKATKGIVGLKSILEK